MTQIKRPLPPEAGVPVLETVVAPEWLDHNGHMNVAGYLVAFDRACCKFCASAGIGPDRIASSGHTIFIGQANLVYRREVHDDDYLVIAARVRGMSSDRFILHMALYKLASDGSFELAAACEELAVCIAMKTRRPAPFPPAVGAWFAQACEADASLPAPRITLGPVNVAARSRGNGETRT
ncbi:acyl-CoA thioesterase [Microvirga pakistanensis]|uniref:acyl-CoA thioesterase n=1 Tax=Microvirga pakistanensis TaxID=1682650 RepID=UPI00106B8345|nr:thioesterase family protein [Microvirga pakistanensis]